MLGQLKVKTSFIFNLFFDADQDLYVVQNFWSVLFSFFLKNFF